MSVILVLGAVATASNVGDTTEASLKITTDTNPTTVSRCDPLERLLGLCRSSQDILQEN